MLINSASTLFFMMVCNYWKYAGLFFKFTSETFIYLREAGTIIKIFLHLNRRKNSNYSSRLVFVTK